MQMMTDQEVSQMEAERAGVDLMFAAQTLLLMSQAPGCARYVAAQNTLIQEAIRTLKSAEMNVKEPA